MRSLRQTLAQSQRLQEKKRNHCAFAPGSQTRGTLAEIAPPTPEKRIGHEKPNPPNPTMSTKPDPLQGHTREWPSTPYSDEVRQKEPLPETSCCIALFGDCTVYCGYFPPANRPESHLAVRLRRTFPDQPFIARNVASDGESAGDFIRSGRMDKVFGTLPRLQVAFIRYGINDRKREGIPGYIDNLKRLCASIQTRYQNIAVIVETGMWVDYPRHYMWDRNAALTPLYDAMRTFAEEAGYPLVDIFTNIRIETEKGNWDLRVRGLPVPQHIVVDDSFDGFFGDDPAFFTNVHPNSRCLGLIADWEVSKLKELFGDELPGIPNDSSLPEEKAKS